MANLIAHLVTHGIVGFLAMDTAVQHMHKVGGRLSSSILETTDIDPHVLLESIAEFYGLEYAPDSLLLSIDPDVPQFWRHDNALRLGAIPLALDASGLTLGVLEPLSKLQLDEVKEEYGSNIRQMLLLEFRFFELCNRFFDVVLEHRYAIWASKFPLKADTDAESIPPADKDVSPSTAVADSDAVLQEQPAPAQDKRTTETTEAVEDHTIETEQTDADEPDTLTPLPADASNILTGRRVPSGLLGDRDSFEAVFAASDDALLLPDNDISALFEPVSDEPFVTPASPPDAPAKKADEVEDAAPPTRRGKEPSMPSIRVSSADSQSKIYPARSRHTPSRIDTVDGDDDFRGREPFPTTHGATQVSGAFRIEPTQHRSGLHPLGATHAIAQQLGLSNAHRSWRKTNATMDALSAKTRTAASTLSSDELRDIFRQSSSVVELLDSTLTYFGAFFERRFFMHFWQPNRSTGLLMQGVPDLQTPFTRIEVPYDESSGVHKMRQTGNYLQGSPIDIGFLTLYTRLGIPTAKESIAMPVRVNNEVVMTLVLDNGPDKDVDASLPPSDVARPLQELGQALTALARRPHRASTPTPFEGEAAAPRADEAPLIPVELFKDISLPPAPSDDLELEMDSMQMDPVDIDEEDHRTLDSIDRIFGQDFQRAQTSEASDAHTTQGSDSFEIAIGTDQELSPAAKALLEQDTRRSDQRAVSIIVGDDERSDADLAYDLIPPTPSDLIRPANYPERTKPAASAKSEDKISRTTARHHALSGHKAFDTPASGETKVPDTTAPSDDTTHQRTKKSRWAAQDLARLLRVGSTEFTVPDTAATKGPATQTTRTLQDTAEQEAATKAEDTAQQKAAAEAKDTAEQEAASDIQDTAEQESDATLEDTAQQEADTTLQDTAEQEAASDIQDTTEQESDATLEDTAQQEADATLQDTAELEAANENKDTTEHDADAALVDTAQQEAEPTLQDTAELDATDNTTSAVTQDNERSDKKAEEQKEERHLEDEVSQPEENLSEDEDTEAPEEQPEESLSEDEDTEAPEEQPEENLSEDEDTEAPEEQPEESLSEDEDTEAPEERPEESLSEDEDTEAPEEDTAARLRAILQERKAAKSQEREPLETPVHAVASTESASEDVKPTDAAATAETTTQVDASKDISSTGEAESISHDETEGDGDDETLMFSPDMAAEDFPQRGATDSTSAVASDDKPADATAETTDDVPPKAATPSTEEVEASVAPEPQSKEIDLDAVLGEVDQSPISDDVDKLARDLSTELADTPEQRTSSSKASIVQLAELTEQQRRMGTSALTPLSLPMETLLLGDGQEREEAFEELLALPANELPDIHSEFPGPLHVDRTDPAQAQLPLAQHGPLLRLVDARLYDFVPQMWSCLERKSADARYYALRFLSLIRNLERRFVLVESALDEDPQIRELALRYIDNFRNSPDFLIALETFRDRLEDTSPAIRIAAADALVKLQDHGSIPLLIKALEDNDADVQAKAHQGLMRLAFIDCGDTPEAWEKWRALHGRDVPEQWLVDAMDAIEPVRRALAARALENISDLTVNYHPEMSKQGLMRAKMTVERHFGLRR